MTNGIANILKPPGMTSHDVVSVLRRIYGLKRVGHAGTLDPAAAGVLPVFLGSATRLIEYTADADKTYRVELTFGYSTDSGDDTGKVICEAVPAAIPSPDIIRSVLPTFVGEQEQIPPMYSALKVDGKRLYQLAREGISVERQPRRVVISSIDLINIHGPTILFDVTCSKGTYIRSLCVDIGVSAGCPAVMSFLLRTRVGCFSLNDASTLEEVAAAKDGCLLPIDYAIRHLTAAVLPPALAIPFRNGQTVTLDALVQTTVIRVYDEQGAFIGIGEKGLTASTLSPVKVMACLV